MPSVECSFINNVVWETFPPTYTALADNIHVWRLQIFANLNLVKSMPALLFPDELVRTNSYLQEKDRQRFVLSRGVLRMLLSAYLGEPAANILFSVGDNKKPFVRSNNKNVHYNIAHAGGWILIAISASSVGTDIEQVNPAFDYSEILPICFSNDEAQSIENNKDFYRLWTRKEALVKATGKGIDDDLPFIPCMEGTQEAIADKIGSDKNWNISSFEIGDQYIASVAYDPSIRNISFFEVKSIIRRP